MRYLKLFHLFEGNTNAHDNFFNKWGTELDKKFEKSQIELLDKAFSLFDKKFIKGRIQKIILKDLGGVHGRWSDNRKKKLMTLNPSIFNFKRQFVDDEISVDYKLFVIVHEISHCIDHIEKVSFSKKWQSISGWKKCPIDEKIPKGWKRYVEKRKGREVAGHKKSDWIHKEDADFCRKYSSRNPREDFADSLSFAVFKEWHKFKGEGGKEKMKIVKDILKKVD